MTATRTMVLAFVLSLLLAAALLTVGGSVWAGTSEKEYAQACYIARLDGMGGLDPTDAVCEDAVTR